METAQRKSSQIQTNSKQCSTGREEIVEEEKERPNQKSKECHKLGGHKNKEK